MTLPAGVYVRGAPAAGGGLAVMKVRSCLTYYIAENKQTTGILNRFEYISSQKYFKNNFCKNFFPDQLNSSLISKMYFF